MAANGGRIVIRYHRGPSFLRKIDAPVKRHGTWMGMAASALLAMGLCSCSLQDRAESGDISPAEGSEGIGDWEMGCPGFDSRFVPTTYLSMRPCLEQLHWRIDVDVASTVDLDSETGKMDASDHFRLSATGDQLVWRWEESGTRDGHYSLSGIDNTLDELVVRQDGQAAFEGHGLFVDRGHGSTLIAKGNLSGPTPGTLLTGIGMEDDPRRLCIGFQLETRLRGEMTETAQSDGKTVQAPPGSGVSMIAKMLAWHGDGYWDMGRDFGSFEACTGAPPDPAYDRVDMTSWHGLQSDEKNGVWHLEASKTLTFPELPSYSQRWTIKLQVNRIARTASLPLRQPRPVPMS